MEPLKKILRKQSGKKANIEDLWKDEQDQAFQKLKQALGNVGNIGILRR